MFVNPDTIPMPVSRTAVFTREVVTVWQCSFCSALYREEPDEKAYFCSHEQCAERFYTATEGPQCPTCGCPYPDLDEDAGPMCPTDHEPLREVEIVGRCGHCDTELRRDDILEVQ